MVTSFTGSPRADRLFAFVWLGFALTSFIVDAQAALGVDFAARGTAFDRALVNYGHDVDPVFLARPDWARIMLLCSGFVFGPLKLALSAAIWRRQTQLRPAALLFCGAYAYSTALWMAVGLFGAQPTPNPVAYIFANGPYLVIPLVFAALVTRAMRTQPAGAATAA